MPKLSMFGKEKIINPSKYCLLKIVMYSLQQHTGFQFHISIWTII